MSYSSHAISRSITTRRRQNVRFLILLLLPLPFGCNADSIEHSRQGTLNSGVASTTSTEARITVDGRTSPETLPLSLVNTGGTPQQPTLIGQAGDTTASTSALANGGTGGIEFTTNGGTRTTTVADGTTSTSPSTSSNVIATFSNGVFWNDTKGSRIEAHGGGFLHEGETWYWFGEDKSQNSGNFHAVNCYASKDLNSWEFRRAIITRETATELDAADRIIERPKVIYNERYHQYVLWLHWEGQNYAEAKAGIFTSSTVDGNYTFRAAFRPNNNMSRDDTLFRDDDGTAYFISAANENKDLVVYELSDDYLTIKRQVVTLWPSAKREAPAMFKQNGRYFLVTSACTGWDSNQAQYATATAIAGPWSSLSNLGNGTTYDSQPTFVLPIKGTLETTFLFVGDRWQDPDLVSSKYVFLPLRPTGSTLALDYFDRWQLNLTTGVWSNDDGFLPQDNWKILYVDSEETTAENGRATRAFDGSGYTFWHTEYQTQKPAYPHELQIDLGATFDLVGLRYLPRQDKDANGMVAKYAFYVSNDPKDFEASVVTGTFPSTRSETVVRFEKKTGRYIRFVALSAISEASNLASVGELDLIGTKH